MIIRAVHDKENPWFQMRRATAQDRRLSFAARGVLAYLFSRPSDWTLRDEDLLDQVADVGKKFGQEALASVLKELKNNGYLVRRKKQGKDGKIAWDAEIYETPIQDDAVIPGTSQEIVTTEEKGTERNEPQAAPTARATYQEPGDKARGQQARTFSAPTIPPVPQRSDIAESVRLFVEISGQQPGIYHQDQISAAIHNLAIWEIVLREWRQGGYGWRSIGRLLTKYQERIEQSGHFNGPGGNDGAATTAIPISQNNLTGDSGENRSTGRKCRWEAAEKL